MPEKYSISYSLSSLLDLREVQQCTYSHSELRVRSSPDELRPVVVIKKVAGILLLFISCRNSVLPRDLSSKGRS